MASGPVEGNALGVVAWRFIGFVAVLVLLVDDDYTDVLQWCEDRGACADDDSPLP